MWLLLPSFLIALGISLILRFTIFLHKESKKENIMKEKGGWEREREREREIPSGESSHEREEKDTFGRNEGCRMRVMFI
jgi:hypothetical protein